MKIASALDLKNRTRGDAPVVVIVTAKGSSDLERRIDQAAAGRVEVLGVAHDQGTAADKDVQAFLDEAGIDVVPAVLVYARGVLLERAAVVRDARAAAALLSVLPGLR